VKHGDIQVRLSLHGEPQKLLTYWRALPDLLPNTASVTILKMNKKAARSPWWSDFDANFYFEPMTRTEKKRAELSISDKALSMTASEIEIARHLTGTLYEWISGRGGLPVLNQPIMSARLTLRVEGSPSLVGIIEGFGDPEVLSATTVGAVYTQGEPRHPDVRWLPDLKGIDKTLALEDLKHFESSLAEGQASEVRRMIDRIGSVFRKALGSRKAKLNKRLTEVMGYGVGLEINGRSITDAMIEGYQYDEIMRWLDGEAKRQKPPKDKIRSWRAT
jgi:hypothetical protein